MRTLLLLAVAFATFTSPVMAQQETGFLNRTVNIGSKPVRYQVYVPFDYTPAKEWPVILFLHGAGERGTDGLRQTQVGLGTAIRQNAGLWTSVGSTNFDNRSFRLNDEANLNVLDAEFGGEHSRMARGAPATPA